jgi:hypothetical protein
MTRRCRFSPVGTGAKTGIRIKVCCRDDRYTTKRPGIDAFLTVLLVDLLEMRFVSGTIIVFATEAQLKRTVILVALSLSAATLLPACSSTYLIRTKEGKEYLSKGKPDYEKDSQQFEFSDNTGKVWMINREEILTIQKH